jgi:hypothetical protein
VSGGVGSSACHFERYPALLRYFGAFWCLVNTWMAVVMSKPPHFEMALTPLLFLAIGLVGTFGRYRITLNAEPSVVETSFGWGFWLRRLRRYEPGTFRWVALRLAVTRADNSTSLSYGVFLVGPSDTRGLDEADDLLKARATAERVAQLLGLGVSDELTQSGYREPGSLDEPLRARLMRAPDPAPLGPPPAGLDVHVSGDELRVALPTAKALPQLTVALSWAVFGAIGCIPTLILLSGLGHPRVVSDPVLSSLLGGMGLPIVLIAIIALLRDLARLERDVTMRVSPRGLSADVTGPRGARTLSLAAHELESVGVGHRTQLSVFPRLGPARIVACADHELIDFGTACSPDQHAWLIRAIHWYLRGARPR